MFIGDPYIKTSLKQSLNWTYGVTQWLPESPRFDVLSGNREKAVATLKRIAKENGKAMPPGKMVAYKQVRRDVIFE